MKPRQKKNLKFLFALFFLAGGFLFVQTVFAQDFGINEVGAEIALPTEDPRIVAARIIRVVLGFLGIVALVIVLYGGFVWMTAAGNEERITKAKKILVNGVIGLVIIIMAFSITSFVINKLLEATGAPVGGEAVGPGGPPGGLPSDAFVVRSIQPVGTIPIRNVVVRVVFNRSVDAASLEGNFTVKKSSDQSLVDGTISVSGSVAEFTPTASCPPPNTDRFCFEADTEFTIEVTTAVRSADGKNLICGGLARSCRENFTTGNLVDVTGPAVQITDPDPGQSVSVDALIPVQTHTTDDAGIAYLEYFADGSGAPWDPNNIDTPDTLVREYFGSRDWDTTGLTLLSRHTLTSRAFDIDTNNTTSSGVEVIVRAAHCFNNEKDADETGIDCGGADCGTCSGGSCTSNFDCASGFCIGGTCQDLPVITGVSPNDGAPGNYITIFGRGFGGTPGNVYFGETRASLPADCLASATWQNNQIIVVVPSMPTGEAPIRVEVPPPAGATPSDYIDRTDDERGPLLPNFVVNDTRRPGICQVEPTSGEPRSSVTVSGTQFGSTQGTSELNFGGTRAGSITSWSAGSIVATVPSIAPATVPIQAVVGGQNSNPFNFTVLPSAVQPTILRFEPTSGPVGEYVTIFGSNFGDGTGSRIDFIDREGTAVPADLDFPPICGAKFWKNDSVVVKVPTGVTTTSPGPHYKLKITTPLGSDDTSDLRPSTFEVTVGTPKPGICLLDPDNGPVRTPVTIGGERFGASAQVNFWRAAAQTVSPTEGGTNIATSVPSGAETGPVNVTVGAATSNNVNFTVRDCRTSRPPCQNPAQECCSDGACRDECVRPAGQGFYFWQFSTGTIPVFPQVVEECTRRFPPPAQPIPSPTPWDGWGQTSICINAKISARFTTEIDLATLTSENIQVYKCIGIDPTPCATLAPSPVVPERITRQNSGPPNYQGSFDFIPSGGLWEQNSWYQVTLSDAITSKDGFALDGDKDGVEGGDYIFKFKTRDSPDLCRIGGVGVWPHQKIAEEEGEYIAYQGNLWAAGDACLLIDGRGYVWNWQVDDPEGRGRLFAEIEAGGGYTLDDSDPPNKVTVNPDGSSAGPDQTVATAREETVPGPDVQVVGRIPSERVEGSGDLKIDFTDPKVVEKWPDCSDACVNAEIGARFNTEMNQNSLDPRRITNPENSKIYIWRCGNGVIEAGEDCDDGNTNNGDGCSGIDHPTLRPCLNEGTSPPTCGNGRHEVGEDCDGVPFPERCDRTTCQNSGSGGLAVCGNGIVEEGEDCDGSPFPARCDATTCLNLGTDALIEISISSRAYTYDRSLPPSQRSILTLTPQVSHLEPNTFYRVVISGNVTSKSGVPLTGLNYDSPPPNPPEKPYDSYSWVFKTKDDSNSCTVDRVALAPKKATLTWIGATQNYISTPYSAPDVCSDRGQRLRALDYNWNWSSADPAEVASITSLNNYPKCGNGVIEIGEDCDDGNTNSGDGCSSSCLNEGSVRPRDCGNGAIEPGEDCDDGNARSGDGCNSQCLHEGSIAGGSVCGDGQIGNGEDCDDGNTIAGDGCDELCRNSGTVTDTRTDPYQTATALGLKASDVAAGNKESTTQISAQEPESTKTDSGDLTVRCDFGLQEDGRTYRDCPETRCEGGHCGGSTRTCSTNNDCELGVGRDTCCHFKPKVQICNPSGITDGCASRTSSDVCRNAKISVTFDQLMDPTSVTGNVLVVAEYKTGDCPTGSVPLADFGESSWSARLALRQDGAISTLQKFIQIARLIRPTSLMGQMWQRFIEVLFGKEVFAAELPARNPWCVWPGTVSSVTVDRGTLTARTKVSFSPTKAFDGSKEYRVIVLGDNAATNDRVEGIKSLKGAALGQTVDSTTIDSALKFGGVVRQVYSWTFKTGNDICALSKVVVNPPFRLFERAGADAAADFEAEAQDASGNPIASLSGVYAWSWDWAVSDPDDVLEDLQDITDHPEQKRAVAKPKNGEAGILAIAEITADTIFPPPGTVGQTKIGRADVIVFLCENPWPSDFVTSGGFKDSDYNFKTYFCRDRGEAGVLADDLYGFKTPVMNPGPPSTAKDDLLREYFFFIDGKYCTLAKIPCTNNEDCGAGGGSCQPSSDAIGIRIYENADHFNLIDWYAAQVSRHGAPSAKTIDGYEAIQDGRTIYVSAANQSSSLYTNVYLISYNEGAHPDTIEIYNQLVNNWKFNINLDNNKLCKDPGGDGVLGSGDDGGFDVGEGETQVICSADLDCPAFTVDGASRQSLCESPKDKLARDMKRLIDLQTIKSAVERYNEARGFPPKLEAGTYVRGITTSKWDSWSVLGNELGISLPNDPLNKFFGCTDPYNSDTCWNLSEQTYKCPALSHIYQYKFIPATGFYEIGTDLEYYEVDARGRVNPSYSWYGSPLPPSTWYKRYEDTCTATLYRSTGLCGDGTINTGEDCEVGQSRTQNCDPDGDGPLSDTDGRQSQMCDMATCRWPTTWTTCLTNCGNGVLDAGEECDRGPGGGRIPGGGTSTSNQYMCTNTCTMTGGYCGDGILQSGYGERCDDGTQNGNYGFKSGTTTPYCAIGCFGSAPYCGDRTVNGPVGREQCDGDSETSPGLCKRRTTAGYIISADSFHCSNDDDCRAEFERRDAATGTSRTYIMVQCEIMTDPSRNYCSATYVSGYTLTQNSCNSNADCGEGEICDLCPAASGGYPQFRTRTCKDTGSDACTWNNWGDCSPVGACGNGVKEGAEECDDGNRNNNDSCTNTCRNARCGDGYVRTGVEMCDAGAANGRVCTAPYGSTCNYCSTECTLRTASGPICGDGTINGPEQCDRTSWPAGSWVCVETSNPWATSTSLSSPTCSPASCQLTCRAGWPCNNSPATPDADGDGLKDNCDPNDDSHIDGCLDEERNCAVVNLQISGGTATDDTFAVYIDGYFVGFVGQEAYNCVFNRFTGRFDCSYRTKTLNIEQLRRGRHNLRIIYTNTTAPSVSGSYQVTSYYDLATGTGVDWGIEFSGIIPEPSPPLSKLGSVVSIDFEVR